MSRSRIRILESSDADALERFLLSRLEASMFLLGNFRAVGILDEGRVYQGSYGALFEEGEIAGVAAHYWNGNVILQAPRRTGDLALEAVRASGRPIEGVLGPSEQVAEARAALGLPAEVRLDSSQILYGLELSTLEVPEALASKRVTARRIIPEDVGLLTEWRAASSIESMHEADTPGLRDRCRAAVERYLAERRMWVLEARGQRVACSAFNAAVAEAVQVGGVWTPPELRRRGYARAAVAATLLEARAEGVAKAILFTDRDNLPAQKAYEALGFRPIGLYRILLLNAPGTLPNTGG